MKLKKSTSIAGSAEQNVLSVCGRPAAKEKSVPQFASYEELAKVPARPPFVFRRGPLQRLFWFGLAMVLVKFFASPFWVSMDSTS